MIEIFAFILPAICGRHAAGIEEMCFLRFAESSRAPLADAASHFT